MLATEAEAYESCRNPAQERHSAKYLEYERRSHSTLPPPPQHPTDVGTQRLESASLDLGERSFAHDQTALPVVASVDHDEDLPVVDPTQQLPRIARSARDAHPENIHRRAELDRRQSGGFAHGRISAIGANHEVG